MFSVTQVVWAVQTKTRQMKVVKYLVSGNVIGLNVFKYHRKLENALTQSIFDRF